MAKRRPPERTTERLELTLQPADAAAIRIAADLLDMSISGYVARLVAVAGDPMKLGRERDKHADGAHLAAAVHQRLEEVRRARADFGRAGGLVKSLFVGENETRKKAEEHAGDLADALREFLAGGKRIEETLEKVGEELAPIFRDIESAARQLSGRG